MDDVLKSGASETVVIHIGGDEDAEALKAQVQGALDNNQKVFFEVASDHPLLRPYEDHGTPELHREHSFLMDNEGIGTEEARQRIMEEMAASGVPPKGARIGIVSGNLSSIVSFLNGDSRISTVEIGHSNLQSRYEDVPVMDFDFVKKRTEVDPSDKRPGHLKGDGARITKMRR